MHDHELRELLRRKAAEMRLEPAAPQRLLKRARRRRIGTVLLSSTVVAGVALGAFLGAHAALQKGAVPPPRQLATEAPNPQTPAGFQGLWPTTTKPALRSLQDEVDQGHMPLLTDPQGVANEFAVNVMGWDPNDVTTRPGQAQGSSDVAIVDVFDRALQAGS